MKTEPLLEACRTDLKNHYGDGWHLPEFGNVSEGKAPLPARMFRSRRILAALGNRKSELTSCNAPMGSFYVYYYFSFLVFTNFTAANFDDMLSTYRSDLPVSRRQTK